MKNILNLLLIAVIAICSVSCNLTSKEPEVSTVFVKALPLEADNVIMVIIPENIIDVLTVGDTIIVDEYYIEGQYVYRYNNSASIAEDDLDKSFKAVVQ